MVSEDQAGGAARKFYRKLGSGSSVVLAREAAGKFSRKLGGWSVRWSW